MVPWKAQKKEQSPLLAMKKSRIEVRPKRQTRRHENTIWALLAAKLTKSRQKSKMGQKCKNQAFWSKITVREKRWSLRSLRRARSRILLCPNKTCLPQWAISTLSLRLLPIQTRLFRQTNKVQTVTKILKFKFRAKMDLQVKCCRCSRIFQPGLSVQKKISRMKSRQQREGRLLLKVTISQETAKLICNMSKLFHLLAQFNRYQKSRLYLKFRKKRWPTCQIIGKWERKLSMKSTLLSKMR